MTLRKWASESIQEELARTRAGARHMFSALLAVIVLALIVALLVVVWVSGDALATFLDTIPLWVRISVAGLVGIGMFAAYASRTDERITKLESTVRDLLEELRERGQ